MPRYTYTWDPAISDFKGKLAAAGFAGAATFVILAQFLVGILRTNELTFWAPSMDMEVANGFAFVIGSLVAYVTKYQMNKRKHA